jgi:archaellum biogenesis ATPase FlaH
VKRGEVVEDHAVVLAAERWQLHPPPAPSLRQYGSSLMVIYAPGEFCSGITLEFARPADHRETLTADVTISSLGAGEIAWDRLNLLAARTRQALAKMAEQKSPEAPWGQVIDTACRMVIRRLRTDDPPVALEPMEPSPETQCLVPGLIFRGEVNLIFADGGSTKSLLALAIAMSGLLGHQLSKVWAVASVTRVLYLDWESTREAHAQRLWGLCSAMERPPEGSILYQRMTRPLTDQLEAIRRERDRAQADLIICDSLGPASGLEPESGDAAIRTLQALRSLGTTVLCLAHVSKAMADGNLPPRPYGSVFVQNLARSTIYLKSEDLSEDGRRLVVNLIHQKVNDGRRMLPSALEWTFEPSGLIRCQEATVSQQHLSLRKRLLIALQAGQQTVEALSELVSARPEAIRAMLNRMETANEVLRFGPAGGGRSNKALWYLADTNRIG